MAAHTATHATAHAAMAHAIAATHPHHRFEQLLLVRVEALVEGLDRGDALMPGLGAARGDLVHAIEAIGEACRGRPIAGHRRALGPAAHLAAAHAVMRRCEERVERRALRRLEIEQQREVIGAALLHRGDMLLHLGAAVLHHRRVAAHHRRAVGCRGGLRGGGERGADQQRGKDRFQGHHGFLLLETEAGVMAPICISNMPGLYQGSPRRVGGAGRWRSGRVCRGPRATHARCRPSCSHPSRVGYGWHGQRFQSSKCAIAYGRESLARVGRRPDGARPLGQLAVAEGRMAFRPEQP